MITCSLCQRGPFLLAQSHILKVARFVVHTLSDEDHVERHLQAKERCQNFLQYGSIQWKIDETLFTRRYTDVIFYYFSLYRNEIIGSSTKLTVINASMVCQICSVILFQDFDFLFKYSRLWMILHWLI